jgi:hypothetical protein
MQLNELIEFLEQKQILLFQVPKVILQSGKIKLFSETMGKNGYGTLPNPFKITPDDLPAGKKLIIILDAKPDQKLKSLLSNLQNQLSEKDNLQKINQNNGSLILAATVEIFKDYSLDFLTGPTFLTKLK